MPELQVLNGPLQWKTFKVLGPRFLIGRKEGAHLMLKDGWISREHAVLIETTPGEFMVQDLDSENGIYVNGNRVTESSLRHQDILRVGRTEVRYFCPAPGSDEVPRRDTTVPDHRFEAPESESKTPADRNIGIGERTVTTTRTPVPFVSQELGSMDMTVHEVGPARGPRPDLRERVRRLEKLLNEKEEENARLAAENAVFKRAMAAGGLLDRKTGQPDLKRITVPTPRAVVPAGILPLISNPLSRIIFPRPGAEPLAPPPEDGETDLSVGLFRLGFVGAGSGGARLVDAFHRIGYRRTVAFSTDAEALADLEVPESRRLHLDLGGQDRSQVVGERTVRSHQLALETAFRAGLGTDRNLYLCCLGLGGATGVGSLGVVLELLAEYDRHTRPAQERTPTGVILTVPAPEELGTDEQRQACRQATETARRLHDAGKLSPFLVVDSAALASFIPGPVEDARPKWNGTIAGVVDMLNRLPLLVSLSGQVDENLLRERLLAGGLATVGLAASTTARDEAGLMGLLQHALGPGLLCRSIPPSRARDAVVMAVIGSEFLAGDTGVVRRVETVMEEVSSILPQAKVSTGIYQDAGRSLRLSIWIGGLPFPERLV